jgi:hypothetical protein
MRVNTMSQQFPANVDPELVAELKHHRKLAATQPHDDVKMDLPEGARVKMEVGVWKVRWRKFQFFIGPLSKQEFQGQIALLSEPASGHHARLYSITVTQVVFSSVRGVKRVEIIREIGSKSVEYALEAPGGYVHAAIIRRGLEWDESEWEQLFSSIQMIKK